MRRVRHTFWVLVAVAVVATGILSRTLMGGTGPAAGAAVAFSGIVLAAAAGLAVRILVVIGASEHGAPDRERRG